MDRYHLKNKSFTFQEITIGEARIVILPGKWFGPFDLAEVTPSVRRLVEKGDLALLKEDPKDKHRGRRVDLPPEPDASVPEGEIDTGADEQESKES